MFRLICSFPFLTITILFLLDTISLSNIVTSTNVENLTDVEGLTNFGSIISSFYSSNRETACSQDTDCLNSGVCNVENYTCDCKSAYWGSNCNFTNAESTKAIKQNIEILDKLNNISINDSAQTDQIANTLTQMTSVKEINSERSLSKTFDVIESLLFSNLTSSNTTSLLLITISNIIEIVNNNNTGTKKNTMNSAISSVDKIINAQLNKMSENDEPITMSTANVEVKTGKLNTNDSAKLNKTLLSVLNSNDDSPSATKIEINSEFISKFSGLTTPSVAFTTWITNPYDSQDNKSNITSRVVSFEIKDSNNNAVIIKGLSNPILIHINKKEKKGNNKYYVCKYWDKVNNKWKKDGLSVHFESDTILTCKTSHLTDFGGSQDDIVVTELKNYSIAHSFGVFASIIYFVVFFIIASILFIWTFSQYDAKNDGGLQTEGVRLKENESPGEKTGLKAGQVIEMRQNGQENENGEISRKRKIYRLCPFISIYKSRTSNECRRKIAGFVLYMMSFSMFLACLYSSSDLDVNIFIFFNILSIFV